MCNYNLELHLTCGHWPPANERRRPRQGTPCTRNPAHARTTRTRARTTRRVCLHATHTACALASNTRRHAQAHTHHAQIHPSATNTHARAHTTHTACVLASRFVKHPHHSLPLHAYGICLGGSGESNCLASAVRVLRSDSAPPPFPWRRRFPTAAKIKGDAKYASGQTTANSIHGAALAGNRNAALGLLTVARLNLNGPTFVTCSQTNTTTTHTKKQKKKYPKAEASASCPCSFCVPSLCAVAHGPPSCTHTDCWRLMMFVCTRVLVLWTPSRSPLVGLHSFCARFDPHARGGRCPILRLVE